ncbi:MAG: hypothetical protein ACH36H_02875 [Candidatus Nanopelagicales bacterium]
MTPARPHGTTATLVAVVVALSVLLLGACGGDSGGTQTPTPIPSTSTASPTSTAPTTAAPTPTATVTVTVAPSTSSAAPTVTTTATATATATVNPVAGLGCYYPRGTDAVNAEETLCWYLDSINQNNWAVACSINVSVPCSQLSSGADTSIWTNVSIPTSGRYDAHPVTFTGRTYQASSDGRGGQYCTDWTLTYMMAPNMLPSGITAWEITGSNGSSTSC